MARRERPAPRPVPLCVYCGLAPGRTQDHVVARCLFPTPPPRNLITVPACPLCNRKKSRDDAFLRDDLTSDHEVHDAPAAQGLFEKVSRAARRRQSELAEIVNAQVPVRVPVVTPAGLLVDYVHQFRLPDGRFGEAIFRIVRGLYFSSRKVRFPGKVPYEVLRHPVSEWNGLVKNVFAGKASRVMGNVFACAYMHATEDPLTTLWLIGFYERAVFTVSTNRASQRNPKPKWRLRPG